MSIIFTRTRILTKPWHNFPNTEKNAPKTSLK